MIRDLILKNRSCRRFDENFSVDRATLKELVDLARFAASGANLQPLKYFLSADEETNKIIFSTLTWAGYLKDWSGPATGERPAAYIVILGDKNISENFGVDHGIAAQNIMLGATEKGLAGCMIGSVDRKKFRNALGINGHLKILLVLALGKPAEEIIIEKTSKDGNIKYWRDDQGRHHVPKRNLRDIII